MAHTGLLHSESERTRIHLIEAVQWFRKWLQTSEQIASKDQAVSKPNKQAAKQVIL